MTFRSRIQLLLPICAMALVVGLADAQQPGILPSVQNAPLNQNIPVDPLDSSSTRVPYWKTKTSAGSRISSNI